jgi:hypothetical protein
MEDTMRMMKKVITFFVWLNAAFFLLEAANIAKAGTLITSSKQWSSIGSAGTVVTNPVNARLNSTTVYVKRPKADTNTISIIYNVLPVDGAIATNMSYHRNWIKLRYRDPGQYSQVKVSLKQLNLATGALFEYPILDSNTRPQSLSFQTFTSATCPGAFYLDFSNSAWFVQVDMYHSAYNAGVDQSPGIQAIQIGIMNCEN